jgi:glycosyltransferase involved in cell wall biosynthesis
MTDVVAPLASCIMPTANRRRFVPGAIAQFLAQDYNGAELVILDDGDDPVADLIPSHPAIRYVRTPRHRSLGAKRNAACEAARGDVILHWDDDDWYAPHRIRIQVKALHESGAELCGIARAFFFDPRTPAAWEYVYPPGSVPWVCGATQCYHRDYWRAHPFADMNVGEDTRFAAAVLPGQLCVLPDNRFFVAQVHTANTSPKYVRDPRWQPRPIEAIRAMIGGEWPVVSTKQPGALIKPRSDNLLPNNNGVSQTVRQGVSVVIPHGGSEKMPHLVASLVNLGLAAASTRSLSSTWVTPPSRKPRPAAGEPNMSS